MQHRLIVAWGFRVAGLLLAIPSAILIMMFGGSLLELNNQPALPTSHPLDVKTYGLVALLQDGATGLSNVLYALGAIGMWAVVITAVLAIVFGVLGLLLFLIGRGIAKQRRWARVAAIVMCVLLIFVAWSLAFSISRAAAAVDITLAAASLYAIWVLGWRYGKPSY